MNTRLQTQYDSIKSCNLQRFLQNDIELDNTWGKLIWGVTLQIEIGDRVKDIIDKYQADLEKIEPDNFLLLPREFQHISFNQVIFWGGEYKNGKKETWNAISDDFLDAFRKLDRTYQSFDITFSDLIATAGGIIWCGYDENDELEKLRIEFQNNLPFPTETTKLNHIIHTTVARYKNNLIDPKRVLDYIEAQKVSASMKVDRIILKKELVFPSIKTEEIAHVDLK